MTGLLRGDRSPAGNLWDRNDRATSIGGAGALKETSPSADRCDVERPFRLSGAWGIANAEELRALFAGYLDAGEEIVLDISGVESFDAAALQLIWSLQRSVERRGLHLRLTGVSPAISGVATALGVPLPAEDGGGNGV